MRLLADVAVIPEQDFYLLIHLLYLSEALCQRNESSTELL